MNKVKVLYDFLNDERRIRKGGKKISFQECQKIMLLLMKEEIKYLNEKLQNMQVTS